MKWPLRRPFLLVITLSSGRQIRQLCWEYSITRDSYERVTGTSWKFAGGLQTILVRADQVAAVQRSRAWLPRWQGFRK